MKIALNRAFVDGDVVAVNGQTFAYLGVISYTRKDGAEVPMSKWDVECAECRETFQALTFEGHVPDSRRCLKHRRPGKPVRVKGKQNAA